MILEADQLKAIEPMEDEEFLNTEQKRAIAGFCNCSLMDVEAMTANEQELWLRRVVAFNKRAAQIQMAVQRAQQEAMQNQAMLQQLKAQNGGGLELVRSH